MPQRRENVRKYTGVGMNFIRLLGAVAVCLLLTGCSSSEWGQIFKNTATGIAEGACRAASNCSTGMRRDPLAPKPAWDRGGASPKDNPFPLFPK
jgi:hypothetical protein